MRGLTSFILLLAMASCRQGDTAPSAAPEAPAALAPDAAPSSALAPVASLAGEWRVAGVDGRDFNEPYAIALSGNTAELWWEPRCAGLVRGYRIDGAAIVFGPPPGAATPRPGAPPPPVCAIAVPERLDDVARAIDAATTIGRTGANGVLIAGGGHSLLLFSQ